MASSQAGLFSLGPVLRKQLLPHNSALEALDCRFRIICRNIPMRCYSESGSTKIESYCFPGIESSTFRAPRPPSKQWLVAVHSRNNNYIAEMLTYEEFRQGRRRLRTES